MTDPICERWVTVPVEPTLEMVEAGRLRYMAKHEVRRIYGNMIAAAPPTSAAPADPIREPHKLTPKDVEMIALLMDEAAGNLARLMDTDMAVELQVRHFLPDELEGSAMMLREHFGIPQPERGE